MVWPPDEPVLFLAISDAFQYPMAATRYPEGSDTEKMLGKSFSIDLKLRVYS